ncbi:MFS transporter [Oleomonas cavernae]|uniref:MFS transporter n=1 Tax=Oleomonas cavernae TaxID=2320859 RepID=A0A418WDA6_9PROT|nr:MFS transporter [Oleomonas cavernae]RJF87929.1 MFS transporter [Oleomonas cavernae]
MTRPMGFILVTILLDAMGFGLIVPVLPHLVERLLGQGPAAAGNAFGILVALYAAMLFLCAPVIGRLSDRFGRRPVILLALAGAALDQVVAATAGSLWLLMVARALAGACGANAAAASAYVADVTPPEHRAKAFGLAGAMFGLGFVLGPALGGMLGDLGPRVPFWVAAGLTALNFLWGLVVLPESLAPALRRPFTLGALNPLAGLIGWRRSRLITGLLGAIFCYMLAQSAVQATWVLFTAMQLGWGPGETGLSLAFLGVASALSQVVVAPAAIRRIGEPAAMLLGLACTVAACIGYSQATQGWHIYAVTGLIVVAVITGPAAQAIITRAVSKGEQGQLQGTITATTSLGAIAGTLLGAAIFSYFAAPDAPLHLPGAAFLFAALLTLVAMACLAYALGGRRVPMRADNRA